MANKKCPSCAEKVQRKYNFCPHCGESFKARAEKESYGFLGRDDTTEMMRTEPQIKLPFGLGKVVDSLVKQLEKQMSEMAIEENSNQKNPHGFKIKISTGQGPQMMEEPRRRPRPAGEMIPEAEIRRRNNLPKIEAESKVRRLSDRIIYEITTPGVHSKKDVVLNGLATGLEVRAYAKDKCYKKHIPIKVEVIDYYTEGGKLFIECRT